MKQHKAAYVYALSAAVLWGSTAAVVKLLGSHLNNFQLLFYTSMIAAIGLLVVSLVQHKLYLLKKYRARDYFRFSYMALLGVFIYYVLLYEALHLIPGQEAFVVNYTWPIWTVIFASIFLRDKFGIKNFIALLLGFIGVVIIVTKGFGISFGEASLYGNGLALLAAASYGCFSVLTKKYNYEKVTSTMIYYAFSFIYVLIYLLATSQFVLPNSDEWPGLLWLGVFTSGIAFVLWQTALKKGEVSKMANIIFITPFLSLIYLALLANEKIDAYSLIGALLIVAGAMIQNFVKKPKIIK